MPVETEIESGGIDFCPKCGFPNDVNDEECHGCGFVFPDLSKEDWEKDLDSDEDENDFFGDHNLDY